MGALLLSAAAMVCLAHPAELDAEVGRRSLPWLPPDLARQVVRHERDFARGAALAAGWPASHHDPAAAGALASTVQAQCERLARAIRERAPFPEIVAGLGALAHLAVDANRPTAARSGAYARAFSSYALSAAPRIPAVFYGQDTALIQGSPVRLAGLATSRRPVADELASIVREDLDRVGGPGAWPRLDDRSSTFGAASLTLNHAASDFANLASWVWRAGGGLVPGIAAASGSILVWKGEPQPREAPRTPLGFRQARR